MKLALGTVQFGLNYGVSNEYGQTDIQSVDEILSYAADNGIKLLDTASAYGNSEQTLGQLAISQQFKLVTKVPKLAPDTLSILPFIKQSLSNLNRSQLTTVLFHHADDLITHQRRNHFYQELNELKQQGIITYIGASLYQPEQWLAMKNHYKLDVLQIPANALDQRFLTNELLTDFKQHNIKLHCRSLFLQGLLIMSPHKRPSYFNQFSNQLTLFDKLTDALNCTPLTLSFACIRSLTQEISNTGDKMIDYLVIGCCSKAQLIEIISAYKQSQKLSINPAQLKTLASSCASLINPSLWKIN